MIYTKYLINAFPLFLQLKTGARYICGLEVQEKIDITTKAGRNVSKLIIMIVKNNKTSQKDRNMQNILKLNGKT